MKITFYHCAGVWDALQGFFPDMMVRHRVWESLRLLTAGKMFAPELNCAPFRTSRLRFLLIRRTKIVGTLKL